MFDSSSSLSPVRTIPSSSEAVQLGLAGNKKFRFDKGDSVYDEGEGDTVPHVYGEAVSEG